MQNKRTIGMGILMLLLVVSCGTRRFLVQTEGDKQVDSRLVGTWGGSETDEQIQGMSKEWVMTRSSDGTFILDFKVTQNNDVQQIIEEGDWWVKDGLFYEFHDASGKTDVYEYTILNKNQVKFKAKIMSFQDTEYEFVDTRVTDESTSR